VSCCYLCQAERAEKERVKRLTLDINERLEEEDYQEMLAQVFNVACCLLCCLKIYFYVCGNTIAFPVTLMEHPLTLVCESVPIQSSLCFQFLRLRTYS
jgi:hypothetical protein